MAVRILSAQVVTVGSAASAHNANTTESTQTLRICPTIDIRVAVRPIADVSAPASSDLIIRAFSSIHLSIDPGMHLVLRTQAAEDDGDVYLAVVAGDVVDLSPPAKSAGGNDPALAARVTAAETEIANIKEMPVIGLRLTFDFSLLPEPSEGGPVAGFFGVTKGGDSYQFLVFFDQPEMAAMQLENEWEYFIGGEAERDGAVVTVTSTRAVAIEYIDMPELGTPAGEYVPNVELRSRSIFERFNEAEIVLAEVNLALNKAAFDTPVPRYAYIVGFLSLPADGIMAVSGGAPDRFAAGEPAFSLSASFDDGISDITWTPADGASLPDLVNWVATASNNKLQVNVDQIGNRAGIIAIFSVHESIRFIGIDSTQPERLRRILAFRAGSGSAFNPALVLDSTAIAVPAGYAVTVSLYDLMMSFFLKLSELELRNGELEQRIATLEAV